MENSAAPSQVSARWEGRDWVVEVGAEWRVRDGVPPWPGPSGGGAPARVLLQQRGLGAWDSSLVLFLLEGKRRAGAASLPFDMQALPGHVRDLVAKAEQAAAEFHAGKGAVPGRVIDLPVSFLSLVGGWSQALVAEVLEGTRFVGECTQGVMRLAGTPRQFRFGDWMLEMQLCGAMALPIVGLVSFLVGTIMAYQAAVQLRQFGADIFVADLVTLAVVREMGPMMAAVVVSGRTGAAFAAQIGNMKANEEVAALEVTGVSPVDFLVIPRMAALFVMMPLLAVYSDFIGVMGGLVVAWLQLDISPSAFLVEAQTITDVSDVSSGLIKSVVFGIIIAYAGCLRGLQAQPSAAGVGRATTSAVVTCILLVILADAGFAVLFNILGI